MSLQLSAKMEAGTASEEDTARCHLFNDESKRLEGQKKKTLNIPNDFSTVLSEKLSTIGDNVVVESS